MLMGRAVLYEEGLIIVNLDSTPKCNGLLEEYLKR